MLKKALVVLAAVFAVGCGGPGSFDGKVDGKSLSVVDAVFAPLKNVDGQTVGVELVMADVPDICATVKANRTPKNATSVSFMLMRFGTDGKSLAPDVGEYKLTDNLTQAPAGNMGFSFFNKSDANCTNEVASARASAKSGLVKVDKVELKADGTLSGTFDATFGSQSDKVTGSFSATYCDVPTRDTKPNCE